MPTATLIPPDVSEVIPAVMALLEADSALETMLGGSGRIFNAESGFNEKDHPSPTTHGFWARVVLMPVENVLDDGNEQLDRVTDYPFQARVDLMPPKVEASNYSPETHFTKIHNRLFVLLEFKPLTLTGSTQVSNIRRTKKPLRSYRDEGGWRYSSAKFLTVLAPN